VRPGHGLLESGALALAAALLAAGCGYGFTQRYVARGGAERIHVRPFENLSTEPGLGAAVTAALRTELARRGAEAGKGVLATIEGQALASEPVPTSGGGATWRIAIEVRARLLDGEAAVAEHVFRRETDYVGGADALESEGRRALALRRLATEAAREILRSFER
jgi:hypothetical protein